MTDELQLSWTHLKPTIVQKEVQTSRHNKYSATPERALLAATKLLMPVQAGLGRPPTDQGAEGPA